MVKRIVYGLILAGLLGLAYLGYNNWRQRRAMMSGEVISGPSESAPPDASVPLPSPSPGATPVAGSVAGAAPATSRSATGAPATDSMPANPPNGTVYSGSGHYQIYRQGNLTYRLNTDTGQSCVLYATNAEWRKPQVYSHGCASSAPQ